jgi:WD40 repeat protein
MADVFVSYARKDRDLVVRLHEALQAKGREAWVDWEGIPPTAEWLAEIYGAIEAADNLLFILSPASASSKVCRLEVEHAVLHRKRLIPLVAADVDPPDIPESVASLNWIFLRPQDGFDSGLEKLLAALDTDLAWVKEHTRLLVRAIQWNVRDRNDAFLLRGSDLKGAESWLTRAGAQQEMRPTELHGEYIAASRRGATRRLRMMLGSVAFAAVVAIILAVLAFWQSTVAEAQRNVADEQRGRAEEQQRRAESNAKRADEKAREATESARIAEQRRREAEEQRRIAVDERNTALSRELATHSALNLSSDPELSLLLAREAASVKPTDQADAMLRLSILRSHVRRVLSGHREPVQAVAFSPDGKRVATAARDVGRIWDAESGNLLCELKSHTGTIWRVEFSPNGESILTVGDFAARIWDTTTGKLLHTLKGGGEFQVWGDLSPDGKLAVTAGYKEEQGEDVGRVWEVATGRPVAVLKGHRSSLTFAEFSPDGRLVTTASFDNDGAVWDARSGRRVLLFEGHAERVKQTRASPDSKRYLTASWDRTARLWDASGKLIAVLAGHDEPVMVAAFSPDSRRVATGSRDGTARIWSAERGTPIAELRGHTGEITSVEFSGDGKWLLTASDDGTARVWEADAPGARQQRDADMFDETKQVGWRTVALLAGHRAGVKAAVFHPNGQNVATAGMDETARIWAPHRWDPAWTLAAGTSGRPSFAGNGAYLITTEDSSIGIDLLRIWRTDNGQSVGEASRHVAFSRDNRWAATSHALTTIWNTRSWTRAATLAGVRAVFSPDGRWAATREEGRLLIWEPGTWKRVVDLEGGEAMFTADSRVFLSVNDDGLARRWLTGSWKPLPPGRPDYGERRANGSPWRVERRAANLDIFDARTGRHVTTLDSGARQSLRDEIPYFELSPRGRYVGAGLLDGTARIWEMGTWRPVATLRGHRGELHHLAFSPDERFMATASEDKSVRVWEVEGGQPFAELRGHSGAVEGVAFSPDGLMIATMSEDKTAHLYRCEVCAPLPVLAKVAENQATRRLSPAERAKYLRDGSALGEDGETLAARGRQLAAQGDIAGAKKLLERAVAQGIRVLGGPEIEAGAFHKEALLDQSTNFARQLDLDRAIALRRRARAREPEKESREIAVGTLKSQARLAALGGDWMRAEKLLHRAFEAAGPGAYDFRANLLRRWKADPSLAEAAWVAETGDVRATQVALRGAVAAGWVKDAAEEARKLVQQAEGSLLSSVGDLARAGQYESALGLLELRPWAAPKVPADAWGRICFAGAASNQARRVLPQCDRAVGMAPNSFEDRLTRAFARALAGDMPGAATDIAAAIPRAGDAKREALLERALNDLRSGRNPFRIESGGPDMRKSRYYPAHPIIELIFGEE